jgi:hypothetical protein
MTSEHVNETPDHSCPRGGGPRGRTRRLARAEFHTRENRRHGGGLDPTGGDARTTRPTAARSKVAIERETFSYAQEGRRDPFVSLMGSSELRPMISDLRLSVVVYDAEGDSRAVLRDINTNEQYKVRLGQQLGRMRVARIAPKSVTFTILEFGESRQETLALNDSTSARTP